MMTNFDLTADGRVSLSRRGELDADGTYGVGTILDDLPHEGIELSASCDEGGIRLSLGAYHVEGEEGAGAWHLEQGIMLTRSDVALLIGWFEFLISQPEYPLPKENDDA